MIEEPSLIKKASRLVTREYETGLSLMNSPENRYATKPKAAQRRLRSVFEPAEAKSDGRRSRREGVRFVTNVSLTKFTYIFCSIYELIVKSMYNKIQHFLMQKQLRAVPS
jgi:hypothetical protein